MVESIKETVEKSSKKPKELFKEMIIYLVDTAGYKMTTISNKSNIKYDKINNTRKGGSSGDMVLLLKLIEAFPELEKKIGFVKGVKGLPEGKEDTEELRKEVERLKTENLKIYKKLVEAQEKLLNDKK